MSFSCTKWAWEQPINNANRKLVLLALADRANDDGECWPGLTLLSAQCSIPRRTVIRVLQELERGGYISVSHRAGEGGGRQTNLYRLTLAGELREAKCQPDTRQSANLTLGKVPISQGAKCQPDTRQSAKKGGAKCQPDTQSFKATERKEKEEERARGDGVGKTLGGGSPPRPSSSPTDFDKQTLVDAWVEAHQESSPPALPPRRKQRIAETLGWVSRQIGKPDWPQSEKEILPWFAQIFRYAKDHPGYLSGRDFDFFLSPDRLTGVVEGAYEQRH